MPLKDICGGLDHRCPKRKLSDSARKRNKKAANAKLSKNRIYIGDEYDRWKEIKTVNLRFGPDLYRMSSNLRSIAYDLHYCPGSKNDRRQKQR
jgi:hypothetical protein